MSRPVPLIIPVQWAYEQWLRYKQRFNACSQTKPNCQQWSVVTRKKLKKISNIAQSSGVFVLQISNCYFQTRVEDGEVVKVNRNVHVSAVMIKVTCSVMWPKNTIKPGPGDLELAGPDKEWTRQGSEAACCLPPHHTMALLQIHFWVIRSVIEFLRYISGKNFQLIYGQALAWSMSESQPCPSLYPSFGTWL